MTYDPHTDELGELLSAYIDGELTADEQARVERRLAESPEFRQLHDELRAVRSSLENLPRYRVTEDLASIVLHRAERALIGTAAVAEDRYEDEPTVTPASTSRGDWVARGLRSFRWTVVALAVAVAIMIFNPQRRQDNRDLAKAPQAPDPRAEIAAAAPAELQQEAPAVADRALPNAVELSAEPAKVVAADRLSKAAESEVVGGDGAEAVVAPAAAVADKKMDAVAPATELTEKLAKSPPAAPAPKVERFAVDAPAADRAVKEAEQPARDEMLTAPKAQSTRAVEKRGLALPGAPMQMQLRLQPARALPAEEQVLVVHCNITVEAVNSGEFEQLLAKQQITFTTETEGGQSRQNAVAGKAEAAAPADSDSAKLDDAKPADVTAIDAILVEASQLQIDAALNELRTRENSLSFVVAEPTSAVALGLDTRETGKRADGAAVEKSGEFDDRSADGKDLDRKKFARRTRGGGAKAGEELPRGTASRVTLGEEQLRQLAVHTPAKQAGEKDAALAAESKNKLNEAVEANGTSADPSDQPAAEQQTSSGRQQLKARGTIEFRSSGSRSPGSSVKLNSSAGAADGIGTNFEVRAAAVPVEVAPQRVLFVLHVVPSADASQ